MNEFKLGKTGNSALPNSNIILACNNQKEKIFVLNRAVYFIGRLTLAPQVVRVVSTPRNRDRLAFSMWVVFFLWATPCEQLQLTQSPSRAATPKQWKVGLFLFLIKKVGLFEKNNNKAINEDPPPYVATCEEDSRQHMHTPAHNINILHREWYAFCVP